MPEPAVHILGIRHHGPGSARSLRLALEEMAPDCILVEGPPDAAAILPLAGADGMEPPAAILIYAPDQPRLAVYYPFAEFSPEWQAIQYGLARNVPVRFMDLPQTNRLAVEKQELDKAQQGPSPDKDAAGGEVVEGSRGQNLGDEPNEVPTSRTCPPCGDVRRDPLGALARACGYSDGERWWDHMVESRSDSRDLFIAILEAMTALREQEPGPSGPTENEQAPDGSRHEEPLREAYMRQTLRAAQKEGFGKIAVVCGAWHGPALAKLGPAGKDAALLKGLPKIKVAATWVPWTYARLAFESGYGAGVESPGWYHHLWSTRHKALGTTGASIRWLTMSARLLREEDYDVSSAHVIEAVRLSESLAAMRGRPLPGLEEFNEACRSIYCFGDDLPLELIRQRLIVGQRLGKVPSEAPTVPLQQDLEKLQKRLRLPPQALDKIYDLDLRGETDLARSQLLHRLTLLGVQWGVRQEARGKAGTFHEIWKLQWQPELSLAVIEAARWGNTVCDSANAFACDAAERAPALPALTGLLQSVLLADLPPASAAVTRRLGDQAALTSDIGLLMDALSPLAKVLRYGNVRQTDAGMVAHLVDGLVARICIGLAGACASLNDDAAEGMVQRVEAVQASVSLLQNAAHTEAWTGTLSRLADLPNVHGLLAGRFCRLLLDGGQMDSAEASRRMSLALSLANDPPVAAAWVEGFLKGSGLLLLHDEALWGVLDEWATGLNAEAFTQLLPLLRRTFAQFSPPERRQIGQRAKSKSGGTRPAAAMGIGELDEQRAQKVLPAIARLLGLSLNETSGPGTEATQ
jgi:hypothetical protein